MTDEGTIVVLQLADHHGNDLRRAAAVSEGVAGSGGTWDWAGVGRVRGVLSRCAF